MATSVYKINKGINRAIEFKGLKAQYIGWLGAGLVALLILFAILYISGLNPFLCLALIFALGTLFIGKLYRISRRHGAHGLMKKIARRKIPRVLKVHSRTVFLNLAKNRIDGKN